MSMQGVTPVYKQACNFSVDTASSNTNCNSSRVRNIDRNSQSHDNEVISNGCDARYHQAHGPLFSFHYLHRAWPKACGRALTIIIQSFTEWAQTSSGPRFFRTLHHYLSVLGGPTRHGSLFHCVRQCCGPCAPSFPSQPEGKIGLPRANPRGRLRSPS